ncbi:hypothetical protein [Xanthomonas hortorum]|uniref:hypothetical protein n=1 Tax=Xanthomonas hortorum TaxID=56454 RepID=UPI000AA4EE77|nr:hypothetical protein [Xanthomonas hortorum]
MNLNTYQREAQKTDRVPLRRKSGDAGSDLMVPLLGLAGERSTFETAIRIFSSGSVWRKSWVICFGMSET